MRLIPSETQPVWKRTFINGNVLVFCIAFILSNPMAQAVSVSKGPTLEQVSQCFFIYGPMLDLAKETSNKSLQDYVLPRISWIWGFVQAKKGDAAFERAFQKNITANKAAGMALERQLRAALNTDKKTVAQLMQPCRTR